MVKPVSQDLHVAFYSIPPNDAALEHVDWSLYQYFPIDRTGIKTPCKLFFIRLCQLSMPVQHVILSPVWYPHGYRSQLVDAAVPNG